MSGGDTSQHVIPGAPAETGFVLRVLPYSGLWLWVSAEISVLNDTFKPSATVSGTAVPRGPVRRCQCDSGQGAHFCTAGTLARVRRLSPNHGRFRDDLLSLYVCKAKRKETEAKPATTKPLLSGGTFRIPSAPSLVIRVDRTLTHTNPSPQFAGSKRAGCFGSLEPANGAFMLFGI